MPHLNRSRLVIWPCESALTISARLSRAFCASRWRARDSLFEMYMLFSPRVERVWTRATARVALLFSSDQQWAAWIAVHSWLPCVAAPPLFQSRPLKLNTRIRRFAMLDLMREC